MMIIVALFLFVLLIVVHEYGHFLVAKRNGVEVEEFGIGFPPKLYGKKMGKGIFEGYYTINLLPLGGFVKLKGENDADKRKGSYGAASFKAKTKIILAGVVVNFVTAIFIFTVLALIGLPRGAPDQFSVADDRTVVEDSVRVANVEPDSVADEIGLSVGDELISLGGQPINDAEELFDIVGGFAGEEVAVQYLKDGEEKIDLVRIRDEATLESLNASRAEDEQLYGRFGVTAGDIIIDRYTWSAPIVGIGTTLQFTQLTFEGLGTLISQLFMGDVQRATESVAGPIGIFYILNNISELGFIFVLYLIAIISLTLAIMNALPIPALDGGRLFLSGLFKLMKKPLTPELEQKINGAGMAFLLVLILLITVVDVNRIIG